MQLGSRWRVGDTPHHSVPPALHEMIADVELRYPAARSWTLTWLEGRPRCALEDIALVTLGHDGEAILIQDAFSVSDTDASLDDDDWLN